MTEVTEVNKVLNSIKTNATGVDNILPIMIKYCGPDIDKYITHNGNACLENSLFPSQ